MDTEVLRGLTERNCLLMKKTYYKWLPVIFCLLLLTACRSTQNTSRISANDGMIDLTQWDFNTDGNVSLNGKWIFYWKQLIAPGEFDDFKNELTGYYDASKFWTRYFELHLPSKGYATYHIVINTADMSRVLSIKAPEIYTEYRLWVNGKILASNGSFQNDKIRFLCPQVYTFYQEGSQIDLVLQVKNNTVNHAGAFKSLILGTPEQINKEYNASMTLDIVQFTISLFAAVYHFFLFLFRKKDKTLLWFACYCFALAVRSAFINEDWIMQVFPELSLSTGLRIMLVTIPICTISLLMYSWLSYQGETPKLFLYALLIVNTIYLSLVLFTPTYFFSICYNYYLIGVTASSFLLLYTGFRVRKKRVHGSGLYLMGLIIMAVSAYNDMIYYNQLVNTGFYLSSGLVAFVIIQSILLAQKYARAHQEVEQLTLHLKSSLEKTDQAETAFLQAQIKPHFLYNSLNTIAECCETDAHEAGNLILSLAKYLRGTLDFANLRGNIELKKELELVKAYTVIEKARFDNINVVFDIADNLPSINLPPLTLQPLVENAIKHGLRKKEGSGTVIIKLILQENQLLCSVEDDGAGIPGDKMEDLLKMPTEGGGIGLYNIHTRLKKLYGKGLLIENKYGTGTKVSFAIPYRSDLLC